MDGAKATKTPVYVLLPHEIIHCLATSHCPFLFNSALLGNLDGVARAQFWSHVYSLDPWQPHPVLNRDDVQFDKLIGVTIHGDGAAMKREDEAFVFSIASCFGSSGIIKDPLLLKYPIAIILERHMHSKTATQLNICHVFYRTY